jgi:CelD/BcsL family acetyltransferase involved in cellulose biosynthesis
LSQFRSAPELDLRFDLLHGLTSVDRSQWNGLVDNAPDSTIFQRFEWFAAWIDAFCSEGLVPQILLAYRHSQLVGIAPLVRGQHRNSPSDRESIHFLGAGHADYQTFPVLDGSAAICHSLLERIGQLFPRALPIELHEIPGASVLGRCLAAATRDRFSEVFLESQTPCPRLDVRDRDIDIQKILNKQSVRRNRKRLLRFGDVIVEHLTTLERTAPWLDMFFEMHVKRCELTDYESLFKHESNRHFYRLLAQRFDGTGAVVFTNVKVLGKPVAQHFGFRSGGDLLWYKPAFDIGHRQSSPGEILLCELIEYVREQRLDALDFTRGDEMFKSRFSSSITHNQSYIWLRQPWRVYLRRFAYVLRRLLHMWRGANS